MVTDTHGEPLEHLLDTPHLADALESDRFKQFLDHIPFAVAVAELQPSEHVVYSNFEFERLTGQETAEIYGKTWDLVATTAIAQDDGRKLSKAITENDDYIGAFAINHPDEPIVVNAWSNIILNDDDTPVFRLVGLAKVNATEAEAPDTLQQRLQDKDMLMRELQHRVKNNLQMITSLIRMEARNMPQDAVEKRFDRLAGRVESLALLYRSLSDSDTGEIVDLGVYLSEVAAAVMRAHALEGIRLDLKVDTWPVSVNVAMPTGLVVNELLTNALKHAFAGREGGTITLHCLVDDTGCRLILADDGIGLRSKTDWPKSGKLSALIVESLRQNAKARIDVESAPGQGMRVTIFFARASATPEAEV
ncbi:sensor histidine kinase [Ferrovibrio terrae]|uniref:sensor histidine kinase n=1 Tax=Ferrovibrio terrae TaxID=2594003 RepID=UPI003138121C